MTNEELRQEIEKLKQEIIKLRFNQLESKCEPIPTSYQIKIPADLENYYTIDIDGSIDGLYRYTNEIRVLFYLRGLAFKTKTEAEQHFKKSMLLFKMHKWAEEYNGGWTPNWNDYKEEKWTVMYHNECEEFEIYENYRYREFLKLPYFESEEIAELFIKEFGDEIKEVLC
jgi:hypothetical protein